MKSKSDAGKLGAIAVKEKKHSEKLERIRQYSEHPKLCKLCLKPLDYKKRWNQFCSHSCSASFNNIGSAKNPMLPRPNCLECGKRLSRHASKFCSREHFQAYMWKKKKERFEKSSSTIFDAVNDSSRRKFMRKYLAETRGYKCSVCHGSQWMGKPMPLICDHIDGNSDNWVPDNLRLVCGNCDMQLPTYKGKNYGKGRAWRRKRMMDGKTY